jgi:hypothetical protein
MSQTNGISEGKESSRNGKKDRGSDEITERLTSAFRIFVQQICLIIQLFIDLRNNAGNGCVDIRSGLDGFYGTDRVC